MGGLLQSPIWWIRTLHIFAAIWLAVGVFASTVVFALLKRASDPAGRAFGARLAWRLLTVYTLPGALLSGALGLYQAMARFGFKDGWIHASLTLWLVLLAIVLFVQMPRVREAARTGSNVPPLVAILTHVNALLIVLMIFLMAFKPF
jgi:putative membrane protein